jgi:hypothetical protein
MKKEIKYLELSINMPLLGLRADNFSYFFLAFIINVADMEANRQFPNAKYSCIDYYEKFRDLPFFVELYKDGELICEFPHDFEKKNSHELSLEN